jgi:hypothetical protein
MTIAICLEGIEGAILMMFCWLLVDYVGVCWLLDVLILDVKQNVLT